MVFDAVFGPEVCFIAIDETEIDSIGQDSQLGLYRNIGKPVVKVFTAETLNSDFFFAETIVRKKWMRRRIRGR